MTFSRVHGHAAHDRVGRDQRMFVDRADAGHKLAVVSNAYRKVDPLILGVPRGGVPVAYEIAKHLDAELDVIVARKLTTPTHPELAVGAVAADGSSAMNPRLRAWSTLSREELNTMIATERMEARTRELRYRAGLAPIEPGGRVVVVVDDGLATGATIKAALRSLRHAGAERVLVAVPVGASQACASIARLVDALICLLEPEPFGSVGSHYEHFEQCTDDEVQRLLVAQHKRRARPA